VNSRTADSKKSLRLSVMATSQKSSGVDLLKVIGVYMKMQLPESKENN